MTGGYTFVTLNAVAGVLLRTRRHGMAGSLVGGTMKKTIILLVGFVFLGSMMLGVASQAVAGDSELVGVTKCKTCHKKKTGDQYKIWQDSAHSKAFETLATAEAKKIAEEKGLGDPQKAEECLACHATHAFVGRDVVVGTKYADAEGVGCEACHGPGSVYKKKSIMKDPEAARAAGMLSDKTVEACQKCHNEKSPTFKAFDFEKQWALIAHPVVIPEKK